MKLRQDISTDNKVVNCIGFTSVSYGNSNAK